MRVVKSVRCADDRARCSSRCNDHHNYADPTETDRDAIRLFWGQPAAHASPARLRRSIRRCNAPPACAVFP